MYICPVCNNDTFTYRMDGKLRLAVCTVCREESIDDDDYEEDEE